MTSSSKRYRAFPAGPRPIPITGFCRPLPLLVFTMLAEGKAVTPAADSVIMDMLDHNEDGQLLQRYNDGIRAPHKTGATDAVRTECTVFYLQSRVVACVFTRENLDQRWVLDSEPQRTMAELGRAIAGAWPRRAVP